MEDTTDRLVPITTRVKRQTKIDAKVWAARREMDFQGYVEMALQHENERQDDLERRLARPEFSD
jgi:hypothetical protein